MVYFWLVSPHEFKLVGDVLKHAQILILNDSLVRVDVLLDLAPHFQQQLRSVGSLTLQLAVVQYLDRFTAL